MIDRPKTAPPIMIAHALGMVGGVEYTNSEAAFLNSVEAGFSVLEADLALTRDAEIVLYHHKKPLSDSETEWRNKKAHQLDWETLAEKKYSDKYPVLNLDGFLALVEDHPDTQIILDIKTASKSKVVYARRKNEISYLNSFVLKHCKNSIKMGAGFLARIGKLCNWTDVGRIYPHEKIVAELVRRCDSCVLDRLIPQVDAYSVRVVERLYDFPKKIWKLSGGDIEQEFLQASQHGCRHISLHESKVKDRELKLSRKYNVGILVYGTDDSERINALQAAGTRGFYVDRPLMGATGSI